MDDAATTASVKAKLAGDEGFKTLTRVTVETVHGTVYLTGVVETPEAKQRASDIAWQAKGVPGVVNNLQIRA